MSSSHNEASLDLIDIFASKKEEGILDYLKQIGKNLFRDALKKALEAVDHNGYSPIKLAALYKYKNVLLELIYGENFKGLCPINGTYSEEQTALHCIAAEDDMEDMIDFLIVELHANVEEEDEDLDTPLHLAAMEGPLTNIQCLVKHGAAVDAPNNKRATPLFHAISRNDDNAPKIVKWLVSEAKAEIFAEDEWGEGALHYAANSAQKEIHTYLISESKNEVRVQDGEGATPLHKAISVGNLDYAKLLAKADRCPTGQPRLVEMVDNEGCSPLLWSARRHNLGMVRWLVEDCKVDLTHINTSKENALHAAAENGYLEVVKFLVTQKAIQENIHAVTKEGLTALQIAQSRGHHEIVQILKEYGKKEEKRDADAEMSVDTSFSTSYSLSPTGKAPTLKPEIKKPSQNRGRDIGSFSKILAFTSSPRPLAEEKSRSSSSPSDSTILASLDGGLMWVKTGENNETGTSNQEAVYSTSASASAGEPKPQGGNARLMSKKDKRGSGDEGEKAKSAKICKAVTPS